MEVKANAKTEDGRRARLNIEHSKMTDRRLCEAREIDLSGKIVLPRWHLIQ